MPNYLIHAHSIYYCNFPFVFLKQGEIFFFLKFHLVVNVFSCYFQGFSIYPGLCLHRFCLSLLKLNNFSRRPVPLEKFFTYKDTYPGFNKNFVDFLPTIFFFSLSRYGKPRYHSVEYVQYKHIGSSKVVNLLIFPLGKNNVSRNPPGA